MTKKIALLIGVSEYESGFNPLPAAVKDVKAMRRVLQHPNIGGFDEVKILTNEDTASMCVEIETFFSSRKKEDILLLYFSGHGIKDDNGRLYFASRSTRKNSMNQLIKSTAVPASFIHDQMNHSYPKRQVIVLDCCFSGAFESSLIPKDDGSVDLQGQLSAEGRVVLASSNSTQYSFEEQGADISIYTRYLVEGIETGEGDLDQDGQITAREIHRYACNKLKQNAVNMKPKIIVLRDAGFDIVIAQANSIKAERKLGQIRLGKATSSGDIYEMEPQTFQLRNFLEPYEDFLKNLVQQIKDFTNRTSESRFDINYCILNIIRHTSKADFVFILGIDRQENWYVRSQSSYSQDIDNSFYFNTLNTHILPTVSRRSIFNPAYHGIYRLHEEKGVVKAFVIIPLKNLPQAEVIVVCGIPQDSYLLGDAYGRILSSFYHACHQLSLNPPLIEAVILDDLKKDFGFVAASLYERRFKLFCERLQRMIIHFEPILHLDADELFVSGWEALARDPDTLTAPSDLFQAVEMWGPRFAIELDQYFLKTATISYQEARRKSKHNRPQDIVPLSVNVYPESLVRTAYFDTVRQVLKDKVITARNLILEISEKAELPRYSNGVRLDSPLIFFKNKLLEYVKQFQIKFAIDDFGVGYASVSRLAGLNPSHVKIDRNLLYYQPSDVIIRFVHELVGANNLNPSIVIVEGIDETTPISLHRLKEIGVHYIQGHIVGKPGPEIYRLSKEKYDDLKKVLLEEA